MTPLGTLATLPHLSDTEFGNPESSVGYTHDPPTASPQEPPISCVVPSPSEAVNRLANHVQASPESVLFLLSHDIGRAVSLSRAPYISNTEFGIPEFSVGYAHAGHLQTFDARQPTTWFAFGFPTLSHGSRHPSSPTGLVR